MYVFFAGVHLQRISNPIVKHPPPLLLSFTTDAGAGGRRGGRVAVQCRLVHVPEGAGPRQLRQGAAGRGEDHQAGLFAERSSFCFCIVPAASSISAACPTQHYAVKAVRKDLVAEEGEDSVEGILVSSGAHNTSLSQQAPHRP